MISANQAAILSTLVLLSPITQCLALSCECMIKDGRAGEDLQRIPGCPFNRTLCDSNSSCYMQKQGNIVTTGCADDGSVSCGVNGVLCCKEDYCNSWIETLTCLCRGTSCRSPLCVTTGFHSCFTKYMKGKSDTTPRIKSGCVSAFACRNKFTPSSSQSCCRTSHCNAVGVVNSMILGTLRNSTLSVVFEPPAPVSNPSNGSTYGSNATSTSSSIASNVTDTSAALSTYRSLHPFHSFTPPFIISTFSYIIVVLIHF